MRSGTAGFLGRHMAIRYYLQWDDLQKLMQNWRGSNRHFEDYVSYFPQNNVTDTPVKLASDFLTRAQDRHMKHFEKWRTKYLYIALAGDNIPATALANWLLERNPYSTEPPIQYASTLHGRTINITLLVAFLTNGINPTDYHTYDFFCAVKELAEGGKLWVNDIFAHCYPLIFVL